jgi:hypothetical protein
VAVVAEFKFLHVWMWWLPFKIDQINAAGQIFHKANYLWPEVICAHIISAAAELLEGKTSENNWKHLKTFPSGIFFLLGPM